MYSRISCMSLHNCAASSEIPEIQSHPSGKMLFSTDLPIAKMWKCGEVKAYRQLAEPFSNVDSAVQSETGFTTLVEDPGPLLQEIYDRTTQIIKAPKQKCIMPSTLLDSLDLPNNT